MLIIHLKIFTKQEGWFLYFPRNDYQILIQLVFFNNPEYIKLKTETFVLFFQLKEEDAIISTIEYENLAH